MVIGAGLHLGLILCSLLCISFFICNIFCYLFQISSVISNLRPGSPFAWALEFEQMMMLQIQINWKEQKDKEEHWGKTNNSVADTSKEGENKEKDKHWK